MKRKIKNIGCLLLALAILPILGGCNDEDDVIDIFTGKTWKLSFIASEGSYQQYNFWGDKGMNNQNPAYVSSMTALAQDGTFTLTFTGSDLVNNSTGGSFSGKAITANVSGTWKADGATNSLNISVEGNPTEKSDVLGAAFISGLRNATKYQGDKNNLFIYYEEGQRTFFLGLKPQK